LGNSTLFLGVPLLVFLERNKSIWIPSDSSPVFIKWVLGLTKGSEAIAPVVVGFGFGSPALAERYILLALYSLKSSLVALLQSSRIASPSNFPWIAMACNA
jgi:hypothetical protein